MQWTGHPSKLVCSLLVPTHIGLQTSKLTDQQSWCTHRWAARGNIKVTMIKSWQWWQTSHFKNTKSGIHHLEQQQTEGRQAGKSHSGGSVGKGAAVPSNMTMGKMKHPLDLAWNKRISWGSKQKPTCFKTKQVEAKPLQTKQVEADHFNQSTRVAQAVKSSKGSKGLSNLYKNKPRSEKQS